MIKKLAGIVLAGAMFGGVLAGSLNSASAYGGFSIVGRGTWTKDGYDNAMTPSYEKLRVRTAHNYGSFTTRSIAPSTSGRSYMLQVRYSCDNGTSEAIVEPNAYTQSAPQLTVVCPGWGWIQETITAFDDY